MTIRCAGAKEESSQGLGRKFLLSINPGRRLSKGLGPGRNLQQKLILGAKAGRARKNPGLILRLRSGWFKGMVSAVEPKAAENLGGARRQGAKKLLRGRVRETGDV